MKHRAVPPLILLFAAVFALAGGVPVRALAQTPPWTGIIAPSRAIDWSQAGVPGGIPVRTTICASIAPEGSASAPVAPTDINAAIASCAAGGVVYLDAGSYYLSSGIDFAGKSDVTLRGAGADQTILYFSGLTGCQGWWSGVCIENSGFSWTGQPANVANWTGGFAAGTTQITLSSTAGIVPGKTMLDLDQLNDPDTDTGGIWMCEVPDVCAGAGPTGATRPNRAETQLVLATAVSGNTVTISPGLYMPNWQASKTGGILASGIVQGNGTTSSFSVTLTATPVNAGSLVLYEQNPSTFAVTELGADDGSGSISGSGISGSINYSTGALSFTLSSPLASGEQINAVYNATGDAQAWWANSTVMGDGVENLTVDETAVSSAGMTGGIAIDNGYGNWVSGVRVLNTARNHVWILNSAHTTIQNSYFYGTKNATDLSYGVEEYLGSDNLIENNIFQHIVSAVMLNGASSGTVVAYNYAIDDYYTASGNYMMAGIEPHGTGADFDLFEGNVSDSFDGDDIHGPQYLDTLFRNRLYGADLADPGRTNHTVAVELDEMHRFFNVIGNVLGDPGFTVNYAGSDPTVYMLGETDWSAWNAAPDALTTGTLLRWGNYDTVNAATEWSTSDIPTSLTGAAAAFDNLAPASQALPASFFLSSKPGWWITPWGTPPWPAIGPDVTGGPGKTGHAYATPAELCYQNTPNDPNYPQDPSGLYVKLFSAGSCYGQPPAAPTALTATVQ